MPYDSFLIDPFLLFVSAWLSVLIAKKLNAPSRVRFLVVMCGVTLAVFWITSISLYFNLEWTRWIWEMCRAANGRDWMINSGVFHFEFLNPPPLTHILSAFCFTTYPFWFWLGVKTAWRVHGLSLQSPLARRWRGQKPRIETWYVTFTDPATGDGYWIHGEIFSPAKGHGETKTQGWFARFPKTGTPSIEHYGPESFGKNFEAALSSASAKFLTDKFEGKTKLFKWNLNWQDSSPPLFTFPRWLWETEILPGAQIVAAPSMQINGTISHGDEKILIRNGSGAFGRIFSHGHAELWVWLHADLGGGDCLEIVAAKSRHKLFHKLGILGFVALRVNGKVWPNHSLLAALKNFDVEVLDSSWTLSGVYEDQRLTVSVEIPKEQSLTIDYKDPDGSARQCLNSEVASTRIMLEHHGAEGWSLKKEWVLDGTAHAEIGRMSFCAEKK